MGHQKADSLGTQIFVSANQGEEDVSRIDKLEVLGAQVEGTDMSQVRVLTQSAEITHSLTVAFPASKERARSRPLVDPSHSHVS